jgi:OmpA-OmpF porin, OOP family
MKKKLSNLIINLLFSFFFTLTYAQVEVDVKPDSKQEPSLASYSKFDFIPGEDVIFFDDFSQDNVGDFPALWSTNGSGEVVTTNLFPGKWLKTTGRGYYFPETKKAFPENFTVEFDLIPQNIEGYGNSVIIEFNLCDCNFGNPAEGGAVPGKAGIKMAFDENQSVANAYTQEGYTVESRNENVAINKNKKYRFSMCVQKQRVRLYINEKKVFDMPRALSTDYQYNMVRFNQNAEYPAMVANFRVAAGLPDMRSKLITEGKLVTHGIYFDINSNKVKPESYGTLKGIAQVLTDNPDVKVKVVGHTDSDGDAAKNLDLSKRRAASVKNELTKNFGIDASRIETDGKGKTEPIVANDNPANKAKNRRVEFIKL